MTANTMTFDRPISCCHSCGQRHTTNSRVHLRGAYTYCMDCLPVNDAPAGIWEALKCFVSWLFSPLSF
jgi:hypothetical protein